MADDHMTDPNMPDELRVIGARIAAGEDPDEIKGVEKLWLYRADRDKEKIAEAHAKFFELLRKEEQIKRLQAACERMMAGGNHLATYHHDATWPPYGADPMQALEQIGAGPEYDMWCCWNAIMCARDSLFPGDLQSAS